MAKFEVHFLEDRCKSCELCISVCPQKILEIDGEKLNSKGFHPARMKVGQQASCIGCQNCATICPDCVISIYGLTGEDQ